MEKKILFAEEFLILKNQKKTKKRQYKFHQYALIERGLINSIIINFLSGDFYQVENKYIEKFDNYDYANNNNFFIHNEILFL